MQGALEDPWETWGLHDVCSGRALTAAQRGGRGPRSPQNTGRTLELEPGFQQEQGHRRAVWDLPTADTGARRTVRTPGKATRDCVRGYRGSFCEGEAALKLRAAVRRASVFPSGKWTQGTAAIRVPCKNASVPRFTR